VTVGACYSTAAISSVEAEHEEAAKLHIRAWPDELRNTQLESTTYRHLENTARAAIRTSTGSSIILRVIGQAPACGPTALPPPLRASCASDIPVPRQTTTRRKNNERATPASIGAIAHPREQRLQAYTEEPARADSSRNQAGPQA